MQSERPPKLRRGTSSLPLVALALQPKWFGYPTFWADRMQSVNEELSVVPDGSGNSMADLISLLNF